MEVFESIRWKFNNANGIDKAAVRTQLIEEVKAFWEAFVEHQEGILSSFTPEPSLDIVSFMGFYLQSIHPQISWEFGPGIDGKELRLVMTPEENASLRPFVDYIISVAPEMEKWEFYNRRPSENLENTRLLVEAKTGSVLEPMKFSGSINDANEIDLVFVGDEVKDEDDVDFILNQAFVVAECMLGEEIMDKWIGFIDSASSVDPEIQLQDITSIPAFVNGLIKQVQAQQPSFENKEALKYIDYNLEPKDFADYPGQGDLITTSTAYPQMWENAHNGESFYSARYANEGLFAYLKIANDNLGDFNNGSEISELIDVQLRTAGKGASIGVGIGKKYTYIDLFIKDVSAMEIINPLLIAKQIGAKAWLQFYDSEWREEWIGVHPESPQPYLPSDLF